MLTHHISRRFSIAALAWLGGISLVSAAELEKKWPAVPTEALTKIEQALPQKSRVPAKQPRKLLVFCRVEGFAHASIPYGTTALARMGEITKAYQTDVRDDMAVFTAENLAPYDAIAFISTTQLKFKEPANRQALMEFLAKGKGLIGIHAATDNFPTWPEAQQLIGGIFHGHPWTAKDTCAVKLDDPTHPIVAAFNGSGFWIRDEIYQITGDYSRDRQRVVMSLDMSKPENQRAKGIVRTDNDFPISWVKVTPTGTRVFYSSLGHREDVYMIPEVMQHFLDGFQFALGDLSVDAVPSSKLSTQPTPALAPDKPLALQDRQHH